MELTSALTLEMLGKPFLLQKRIDLLYAIEAHGSISKAAKAVPMSYKSAWEAVDMMNSLSPEAIVKRETGGKDGGGTTITEYGKELLANYALLKQEHTHFLERLAQLTDIQSGSFKTIGRLALQISARNQLQAEVLSITHEKVNAKIELLLKGGQRLTSSITKEAVEHLHIETAETVTLICKSSSVHLADTEHAENLLKGSVEEVESDAHNMKVVVDIGGGDKMVSVMPKSSRTEQIKPNTEVKIMIKANDIMLGK